MLAVVSAVVAFDRWPGGHVAGPVQTLVLTEKAAPIRVSAESAAPSVPPGASAVSRATGAIPRVRIGPVQGQRVNGGTRTPAATTPAPAVPVPQAVTKAVEPVQQAAAPIFGAVSNPRTTAGQVADGAQAVTNAAAGSLTAVSPDLGTTVSQTGQVATDAVRQVPLPDHVIPGY